uniref:Phospholipase A(2) n=1 Tax=Panagrellus redivivus TaxID=6233 RepID=A0A7E4VVE3_PANRE
MSSTKTLLIPFYLLLLVNFNFAFYNDYYCGTGIVSNVLSLLATTVCQRSTLNNCCQVHDNCYDTYNSTRELCDAEFCACAQMAEKGAVCRWWIGVSHCKVVELFGSRPYRLSQKNAQLLLYVD